MKEQFATYEIAYKLKELGFDEPCFSYYTKEGLIKIYHQSDIYPDFIPAPLYQQAFRWFREKYRLYPIIDSFVGVKGVVKFFYKLPMYDETFNTYEEAESACLDKLIEICKNK